MASTVKTTDVALGADIATALYGVTGAGEKIGIISDSFNSTGGAATDMAAGILPSVTVLSDQSGTDEGRAMTEIAYSVAPGATYYTADGGTLAQNVAALQAAGVNIIIDDLSVGGEALYQIGSDTDIAIQTAVAANIDYFTSAGNNGNDYYEHGFTPLTTTIAGLGTVTANDFGGGNAFLSLTFAVGAKASIQFQWAQPFGTDGSGANSPQNSLAIYLLDASGNIVAFSNVDEVGAGNNPVQTIDFTNNTSGTAFRLVVVQNGGTVPAGQLFKFFINDAVGTINDPNAGKGSGDLLGHELLPGINVVGAVNYANTPAYGVSPAQVETFSSVGPGTILFDANGNALATPIVSDEPQFEAVDATLTGSANTNFATSPFFGTSAAAPAAGAVGALVLQADTALSTTQVTSVLGQSVIPASGTGYTGAGLIQARAAVEIAAADAGDRWTTAAGGNWNNAASWSTGTTPTSAIAASLSDNLGAITGSYTVTVNSAGDAAGSIAISAPAGSAVTLNVTTGGLLAVGQAGATNTAPTATDITSGDLLVSDNGTLNVTGGIITETGSLNVNNGTVTVSLGSVTANNYAENAGLLTVGGGSAAAGLTLTGLGFVQTGGMASIASLGTLNTSLFSDSDGMFATALNGTFLDSGTASFTNNAIFNDAGLFDDTGAASFLKSTITDSGSFIVGSATISESTFNETGSLVTTGALNFDDTGASVAKNATINAGSLGVGSTYVGFSSTLTIAGTVTDAGGLGKGGSGVTGSVALQTGGELDVGGANDQVGITFTGNGLLAYTSSDTNILVNQETGFITGLAVGNGAIDFKGLTYNAADTLQYFTNNGQASVIDQNGTNVATVFLNTATNYTGLLRLQSDGASNHIELVDSVPCYCPGTLILTDHGEVPVEDLVIGDRLVTKSGEARALKWIGRRSYIGWLAATNPKVWPVCFQPGALADGVPRRALFVSPEHAMFLNDALVPAGLLVNGVSVTQTEPTNEVHYFHLELDSHDVIWAEGALAESFIDDGSRGMFHNAAEFRMLYPDAADAPAQFCAPRVEAGHELESVQRRLVERARLLRVDGRATPAPLAGYLDHVSPACIGGWARHPACPEAPVKLVVFANGVEIGRVVADRYRGDLLHAGIGDGRHSFELPISGGLASDIRHEIEVRSEDGWVMPSFCSTVIEPLLVSKQELTDRPVVGLGQLRGFFEHADRLSVRGWAQDAADPERPVGLVVTVNGQRVARILANRYRGDLEQAGLGSGRHAFELVFADSLSLFAAQEVRVVREADGAELPDSPIHLQAAIALDETAETQFAAMLGQLGDEASEDRALKLLTTQTELLLARRAARRSGRSEREALRQFRRRWGPDAPDAAEADVVCAGTALQVLVVDALLPRATRDAGSVAILSHARALQTLGYRVSFVAANDMRYGSAAVALEAESVTVCSAPHYVSVEDVLRLHAGTFDAVYLHRADIADRYLPLVRQHCPRARVIYSIADLHHVRLARQAQLEQRPELLAHSRTVAAIEIMAARRADVVLTHSPVEAALLGTSIGIGKVHVVPFAVESRAPCRAFADRQGIVFVSNFGHPPNQDAVHHLLRDVLPLVWTQDPSMTCQVVGHGWEASKLPGLDPRVTVVGPVEDLDTVFGAARLSIAPLRYGAGIKGKVLDSFAAGLPCAMTPIAAEGLPLGGILPQLVADGAAALAACILRLHADPAFNEQAGREAAGLVATVFGQHQVVQALGSALGRTGMANGQSRAA